MAPQIHESSDRQSIMVPMGPALDVGQARVDPEYPDQKVYVVARGEKHWRINYLAGGHAWLPEETIRALYPTLLEQSVAS